MKPKIKQEVAITTIHPSHRVIYFYASRDAANEFAEFGTVGQGGAVNLYCLIVDARFDFDEVLAYIKGY